ncbi:B-cell CLL/lymphoma 6 member B protein isoform X1 [Pleurodeles waltl]
MESSAGGYIKEFTRHSNDVLLNLNELRKRQILTDVCLLVGGHQLRAHKAVLMACSGFFYSVFLGKGGNELKVLPLPDGIELRGFQVLLDFMYTSRLVLSVDSIRSVLDAAERLCMDHVMDTCRRFIQARYNHTTYQHNPDKTTFLVCPAPLQEPECAYLHPQRVQEVPAPTPEGATPSPLTESPAAGSCQRGSVVRCPESWTQSQKGWAAIKHPPGPFQKISGLLSSAEEKPTHLQEGAGLGDHAQLTVNGNQLLGKNSQNLAVRGGPSRADEGSKDKDVDPTSAKPSVLTPNSPMRSDGHPNSPTESSTARCHSGSHNLDPKACNWKKYKFIVLNSLKQEEEEAEHSLGTEKTSSSHPFPPEDQEAVKLKSRDSRKEEEVNDQHGYQCGFLTSPSQCFVCGQWFQGSAQLRHHALYSHAGEEQSEYLPDRLKCRPENSALACGACDLHFQEEEQLQRHFLLIHNDEKPYKCSSCVAAFRYKGNLASHRAAHSGEKPYRCSVCGAQFNRPANLKTHSRIHSGEKPYKCETCGSRFVQVAHLRAHALIHTGEKPYPCETCGTRFRHLQTLKSHIRIHTGEKPYQCEACDLHFRHKSQLRLHLRQKHGAITNTKIAYKVLSGPYATGVVVL